MGIGMSTIVQWTLIAAVIGGYFYLTKKPSPTLVVQKAAGAKPKDGLLDDASGAEKKKKGAKKDKKQQKPGAGAALAPAASKDLQIPKVTLESEDNDDTPVSASLEEDKGSLQRLAGFKTGQPKTNKPEPKSDKKKADKQSLKAEGRLTPVPVSPSLGAVSSTSSTTGADGDIDEPDSVDEGNLVDDMLEKTAAPSVMRITPAQDEFTTVTRKKGGQQSGGKDGLTALQKKNQKKKEVKKEIKQLEKEDQLKRLESHKREQRLAREAEAAKHPKKNQAAAPTSGAWSGSNTPNGQTPTASGGLLDTFDSSNSTTSRSGITPSSSSESGVPVSEAIPEEYLAEHHAAQRELPLENEWVEVKPRQKKKKPAPTESETDSDAHQNLAGSTSTAGWQASAGSAGNTNQQAQPKPKRVFTEQDLKIPNMPAAETSDGWDAHAW
ncbi:hypothetical protein DRE_00062 [Drechslerella stenobrocha 248]|uniref:Uncharacterized protein n=1 Tax=Drechslerella stenobrocha 248 TaxID=1043628 RepID=W7I9J2_9PEZI|nr:hypothetical protein DRE_00062 [Drechslerella stenobrocha 248]